MLAPCIFLSVFLHFVHAKMEGFVVGGKYAEIEKYPHAAFLFITCTEKDGRYQISGCGSSILNQNILLTAAHCFQGNSFDSVKRIFVKVGSKNKRNGIRIVANRFIIHELYDEERLTHDIALVRLSRPVKFSSKVSRVAIMHKPPQESAMIAGWGLVNEELHQRGNLLKELDQELIKTDICLKILGDLPQGTVCASSKNNHEYLALGDSGSALVVRGYIQVGLLSFKVPSVDKHIMVYTDVAYFFDWISDNAFKLTCELNQYMLCTEQLI